MDRLERFDRDLQEVLLSDVETVAEHTGLTSSRVRQLLLGGMPLSMVFLRNLETTYLVSSALAGVAMAGFAFLFERAALKKDANLREDRFLLMASIVFLEIITGPKVSTALTSTFFAVYLGTIDLDSEDELLD